MEIVFAFWKNTFAKLGIVQQRPKNVRRGNDFVRRLRFENLENRQMLSITVDTLIDEQDGDITNDDVSLRDAVLLAPHGETIDFAPSLNGATITLAPNLGHIEIIGKSLTIDASMLPDGITIDAQHGTDHIPGTHDGSRIFNIADLTGGGAPPLVTLKMN